MTQNLKWYQKKNGIIIVLILFFPVGLYLMWKHSDWNNKTKVIITSLFLIAGIFSITDESSDSKINESSINESSIYGTYSDFSRWHSSITGKVVVNEKSWMYIINDNNSITTKRGKTNGSDLLDEYGMNKVGYISMGKVYVYYLNGFYPVGK